VLGQSPKAHWQLSLRLSIAQSGHTHPDVEVLRNDIVMLPHIPDKQSLVALGKKVADQKTSDARNQFADGTGRRRGRQTKARSRGKEGAGARPHSTKTPRIARS
jgi:hypothetical protein